MEKRGERMRRWGEICKEGGERKPGGAGRNRLELSGNWIEGRENKESEA